MPIINFVARSEQVLLLNDAGEEGNFRQDPYLLVHKPQSVVCLPIINHGKMMGVLYLENSVSTYAFTKERLRLLSMLSSQIAISIENAQFYSKLEGKVADRTRELEETLNQLKVMQNQLIQQEKLASLGMLTAGIAHELKNPLNFVINFSEMSKEFIKEILDDIDGSKDLNKEALMEKLMVLDANIQKVDSHGLRADRIIQGMLAHSRIVSATAEETTVHTLLGYVEKMMNDKYDQIPLKIVNKYDPLVTSIEAFAVQLEQAFFNIIDNGCYALAEKFAKGGPPFIPTLEIQTINTNSHIIIKIKDNGSGIPQSILNKIFDPFFTTKPTGSGTGLGLSLAYDIIAKQHNGTLKVISEADQFTEFTITLPRKATL